ncbi:hypothetical protein [Sodalis glossinidius]|uniref:hypothetical protein n=1 Tax=Sodalis glossinidius TaxID=63612 RepID=UPI001FB0E414|nr:hypothetical protein [Sodalis glossinidius]
MPAAPFWGMLVRHHTGHPLYPRILGQWPGTQFINTKMQQEAMKLPYVSSASCTAVSWWRAPYGRRHDDNRYQL